METMKWSMYLCRVLAGAWLLFGTIANTQAGAIDPTSLIAGKSQLELSELWWKNVLAIPKPTNPLADTTGALANIDNTGPVYFVYGSTTAGATKRSFTVPEGRPLFLPIINAVDVETDTTACNLSCAFGFLAPFDFSNASGLHVVLDGVDLLTLPLASYRQTSTGFFKVDWQADDVFGFGLPAGVYDAVSDGYWIGIDGLSAGPHTLVFGGAAGTFSLEVTDKINAVPLPSAFVNLLFGLGATTLLTRRRLRAARCGINV